MSSVLATPGVIERPHAARRRTPFEGIGRRHAYVVLGFAVGVPVIQLLFATAFGERIIAAFLIYEFATIATIAVAAQLSALAVDNLMRHRIGNVARVALAILVASVLAMLLLQVVHRPLVAAFELERLLAEHGKAFESTTQYFLYELAGTLRWSTVMVVFCGLLETHCRAQDALHAVQMSALAAERDLVEGGLRTMQARVDPDLLFDALLGIDRAYARDLAAGQSHLDALIRFLRAALPGDGNGGSSVGREQELVEAYVGLLNERGEHRVELELSVAPATHRQAMPAMLLLPLVKWALPVGRAARLRLTIQPSQGALAAIVECDAACAGIDSDTEIAAVRERLSQIYASGATLRIDAAPGTRRAELTLPL